MVPGSLRPLRRSEYDRLVDAGTFAGERLELLFGNLVAMSPQGVAHVFAVRQLFLLFSRALLGRAEVFCQMPLALSEDSEPEPDLFIAQLSSDGYASALPSQALLVIEVADTSLVRDVRLKAALYASCGVPEYWVFDLAAKRVLVHRGPAADGYGSTEVVAEGETLRARHFADIAVRVADFLPR